MGVKPDIGKLARTIEGAHAMLSVGLKAPFLKISGAEATMLAEGVADVAEQFDAPINPKVMAVMNLFGAACAVYLPRAFIVYTMSKQRPRPQTAPSAAGVREEVPVGGHDASAEQKGKMNFG